MLSSLLLEKSQLMLRNQHISLSQSALNQHGLGLLCELCGFMLVQGSTSAAGTRKPPESCPSVEELQIQYSKLLHTFTHGRMTDAEVQRGLMCIFYVQQACSDEGKRRLWGAYVDDFLLETIYLCRAEWMRENTLMNTFMGDMESTGQALAISFCANMRGRPSHPD